MLSQSAFNAFLKTLEEPPHHAIFILATTEKHKILPTILSRCQIYDFNRISVDDTVNHLSYVAATEGVQAEPEALNVIALKADGGMRDALSIFDQVVSFTAGNITYQSVIDNLNVLDYEYYFRLTDCLLTNKVSESLLLFDEVLSKGFDGSHFVTGLSSHFRDLLVSKDPSTLVLLQVGAAIRERYQAQAQKCPLPFLYQAIKLCNDCDMNYRASKNKRLLVELTLIQVAQITAEGDDVSGGRSPKKILKPVFNQAANAQQSQSGAQAVAQTQAATAAPASAPSSIVSDAPSTYNTSPAATSAAPSAAQSPQPEIKGQVLNRSTMRVSIKNPVKKDNGSATVHSNQASSVSPVAAAVQEDFIFNEKDLNYYWQAYAAQLPKEQVALAKRMQLIRPVLLSDGVTFEIVVENEMVGKDFTVLITELQNYMRTSLQNSKVRMTIRISEAAENNRPISRVEKFQQMVTKNNALMQLKETFGLELY